MGYRNTTWARVTTLLLRKNKKTPVACHAYLNAQLTNLASRITQFTVSTIKFHTNMITANATLCQRRSRAMHIVNTNRSNIRMTIPRIDQ